MIRHNSITWFSFSVNLGMFGKNGTYIVGEVIDKYTYNTLIFLH
jgi:hypothetical protein